MGMISSGTEFKEKLEENVVEFLKMKIQENEKYRNLNIIFSNSHVP